MLSFDMGLVSFAYGRSNERPQAKSNRLIDNMLCLQACVNDRIRVGGSLVRGRHKARPLQLMWTTCGRSFERPYILGPTNEDQQLSTKPCPTTMITNIAYNTLLYYMQKTHDAS